jgi:antirestriction protein
MNEEYVKYAENSSYDEEVFEAAESLGIPPDMVEELYEGEHASDADFAQALAGDMGLLPADTTWPTYFIDWEAAACDLMMDYDESDGHYFRASY